jgi:hypothetical protein
MFTGFAEDPVGHRASLPDQGEPRRERREKNPHVLPHTK